MKSHKTKTPSAAAETQKMLDSVYDDLAKGFTTDKLVICGDETFNIDPVNGNAAKGWKEKFPDRGEPTASDLYLDSMDIINDIAGKDNNRQVMYWADMVIGHNAYDQAKNIMDNAIIMDWGYTETYDFESHAKIFEEKEMPFYVCPGDNSWSTIAGNTTKTQLNAEHAALAGKNHKAIGYMMTNWGDYGHYQNIVTQYPAIAYAGGLSWCYDKNLTIDNEEMSYDAFLNTFVYQDSTGTISQVFSEFANFTTRYGIGGFNESYLATSWTEGANSYTHLDLLISAQTDANTMDQKRDNAIEDMKNISIEADNFLKVLSESNIQCDDSDLVYMEFENTAKQVKVATDFVSMRLRLYNLNGVTQITNEVEEAEQALNNLNYFNEMIEQFKTIWKERDEVHLLDSTINQISTPAVFYNGLIGLENIYKPISSDNLFIITPETMNSLNAEDFVQGANWATAGNKEPSLIHIYLGNDSKETVKDALDKGLFRLEDNIIGAEGKVFVADTKVANDNNLNHTNGMFPFLYFPAILPNDGVYEISAKLKYKNGSPVDGSTILVNGTMIPNSGGQIIIENPGEGNGVAEFSEPDENGWVTLKYTFESGKGRAVSVDFKPFGSASSNGDSLYINNLVMRKIKDIFEDVTISSGHSSYNTISLGDIFIVPNAKSSGKEAITINMILPDGSKIEVRMKDQVKAEDEGIYRLIYDSSEAK